MVQFVCSTPAPTHGRSTAAASEAKTKPPLLKDYVLRGGRLVKKAIAKPKTKHKANSSKTRREVAVAHAFQPSRQDPKQRTLHHVLPKAPSGSQLSLSQSFVSTAVTGASGLEERLIGDTFGTSRAHSQYIEELKRAIHSGELQFRTGPWVHPSEPLNSIKQVNASRKTACRPQLNSAEVRSFVFRPLVFAWAPHLLFKGMGVACPKCRLASTGATCWGKAQVVHLLEQDAIFIATIHSCLRCPASGRVRKQNNSSRCFRFSSCDPAAISLMPEFVQAAWELRRISGKILCGQALVDNIRAWATRTSWAATAAVFNELRATHNQMLERKYAMICQMLQLEPVAADSGFSSLTARQISNIYDEDFRLRKNDVILELLAENPGEILSVDWTESVATSCNGRWMLNAMDSNGKILSSILTTSTSIMDVEPVLRELRSRGLEPKAVYVDNECCGAWKSLVAKIWPTAYRRAFVRRSRSEIVTTFSWMLLCVLCVHLKRC